jgi:WD40 repeat protein
VSIWSVESLELLQRLGPFGRTINKIVFTYDGVAICIAMEGQIEVWHMRENRRLYRRTVRGDRTSVLTLPDGGMLVASKEGLQRIELDNPEAVVQFVGHKSDVWGMALDPNGPTVVSFGRDKSIRFWDARNGIALWKMDMKTDVNAVSVASTGRLGVALSSAKGWIWELERRK